MKLGFTGTQSGLTDEQTRSLYETFASLSEVVTEFHHGDCVGADVAAHGLARALLRKAKIIGHPPVNPSKRAFCEFDEEREPKPYLDRNHDIVDETELMLATPKECEEVLRSGTWATIRYANKHGKPVRILWP